MQLLDIFPFLAASAFAFVVSLAEWHSIALWSSALFVEQSSCHLPPVLVAAVRNDVVVKNVVGRTVCVQRLRCTLGFVVAVIPMSLKGLVVVVAVVVEIDTVDTAVVVVAADHPMNWTVLVVVPS